MIKALIKKYIIEPFSVSAVHTIVDSNVEMREIWEHSKELLSDLRTHFTVPIDNMEIEHRIRLLIVGEAFFIKKEVMDIVADSGECSYADIGDSDGSVRLLLDRMVQRGKLNSVGINLQRQAVEKMANKWLDAICADALAVCESSVDYDLVSAFETLEHLSDPIGFLNKIKNITKHRLIISVPYIRKSRVGLTYLSSKWSPGKTPTIENTHIFELSPRDWGKIFRHTGWKIDREWKLMMFPRNKLSRLILQPYWRFVSFEGFWFVSLSKCNKYVSQYVVE